MKNNWISYLGIFILTGLLSSAGRDVHVHNDQLAALTARLPENRVLLVEVIKGYVSRDTLEKIQEPGQSDHLMASIRPTREIGNEFQNSVLCWSLELLLISVWQKDS